MTNFYKGAGERIYLVRIMRGYSREKLAELADITPKFLYEIETGRKGFSAIVLYSLCSALEVKSDYILTGKDEHSCDQQIIEALQLFNQKQITQIGGILKQIYELL